MVKNVLLLSISFIVALGIGELVLRHSGNFASYSEQSANGEYISFFSNQFYRVPFCWPPDFAILNEKLEFTSQFVTNSLGLRNAEVGTKKGLRILVLGDSFTEGFGAPNDSTYPILLQKYFHENDMPEVEVINAGVSGSDIFFALNFFVEKLSALQPDIVIYTLNNSDIIDYSSRGGFERFLPNGKLQFKEAPWYEPLYAQSHFVRAWVHIVLNRDFTFATPAERVVNESIALQQINLALDSMFRICESADAFFVPVLMPMCGEVIVSTQYFVPNTIAFCKKNKLPYIDTKPCLENQGLTAENVYNYYYEKDMHFTPKGYALLAKCVHERLVQLKLIALSNSQ